MSGSLLATKLFIPPPGPFLVERPRLKARLDGCLGSGCRLALVSAPAGFGKSTLVSSWVMATRSANGRLSVAWISLDEQDNDPIRFWVYLCDAFQELKDHPGKAALTLLGSTPVFDPEPILAIIINDLAKTTGPIVLVLDDFHLIESTAIHESLAFFLERLPPNIHLLVLTRADPPFPLALLRSRGQLVEIRMADLRFSLEEAITFLNSGMRLNLKSTDVQSLNDKTEGWAAGLQMVALAMQEAGSLPGTRDAETFIASFSGSNRFILDYLVEEVLKRQPAELQTFLLKTSILDQVSAGLCDALLANTGLGSFNGSQAVLDYLERANLFIIRLDQERRWYRYHALFADLLRKRLLQEAPSQIKELHQLASLWYKQNNYPQPAFEHALQADCYPLAAELLEAMAEDVFNRGENAWLMTAIQRLPQELIRGYPLLCIYRAAVWVANGNLGDAEESLSELKSRLAEVPMDIRVQDWVFGIIASLEALIAVFHQDEDGALKYAGIALEKLREDADSNWKAQLLITLSGLHMTNGNLSAARSYLFEAIEIARRHRHAYMFLDATSHLSVVLWMQGRLMLAAKACQDGLEFIKEHGLDETPVAGLVYLGWGFVLCERHELELAGDYIRRGRELSQTGGSALTLLWADQVWMRYLSARGDFAAADTVAQIDYPQAGAVKFPLIVESGFSAVKVWVWIRRGKIRAAETYFEERQIRQDGAINQSQQGEYLALAYLLIKKGELEAARSLLERIRQWTEAEGQVYWLICSLVNLALVSRAQKKLVEAVDFLSRSILQAKSESYLQVFIDEEEGLTELIEEAARSKLPISGGGWLVETLRLARAQPQSIPEKTKSRVTPVSDLSPREIEVLLLVAEGLSNKEIAQKLYISLRTVKFHTTSIFTRLEVDNRIQAVSKAKQLGILK